MNRRRALSAVVLAVLTLILGSASPVVANHNAGGPQTTGGVIINSCQSEGSIYVTSQRPVDSYTVVPTCKRSDQPPSHPILRNVQGFKVSVGYRAINVRTGYVYVGGQYHYMCCNNTVLTLRVDWLGNNALMLTTIPKTMFSLAA